MNQNVDVIAYETIASKDEPELRVEAKMKIEHAMTTATFETAGDQQLFGNDTGRDIFKRLSAMEKMINDLMRTSVKREEFDEQSRLHVKREEFEEQSRLISNLRMDRDKLWAIRERTIDTFKRDHLKTSDKASERRIKKSNRLLHQGDAVTDALMFTERGRNDIEVFKLLYGLSPEKVIDLYSASPGCINILNHAARRRLNWDTMSYERYAVFRRLMGLIEKIDLVSCTMDQLVALVSEFWETPK